MVAWQELHGNQAMPRMREGRQGSIFEARLGPHASFQALQWQHGGELTFGSGVSAARCHRSPHLGPKCRTYGRGVYVVFVVCLALFILGMVFAAIIATAAYLLGRVEGEVETQIELARIAVYPPDAPKHKGQR
jgi:hypothetical protein